jgi:hypothetical protein
MNEKRLPFVPTKQVAQEPVPPEKYTIRCLPVTTVFLYETDADFASLKPDHFRTLLPGNSLVICVCRDRDQTIILDRNARIGTVY